MQRSGIEWTDYTANPLRARNRRTGAVGHYCEHMSRGCQNCYAEGWNARTRGGYGTGLPYRPSSLDELELFVDGGVLAEVRGRRKPCRLFWCSMTDLALHVYSDSFRDEVLDVIDATPHITHQVLTKRPEALGAYLARRYAGRPLPASLWVGATVEDQDQADRRLPALRGIPAAVRWLSCEPLLEAVRLDLDGVRWVVVGGESGAGSRACEVAWVRGVVEQCLAAAVKVFTKQLGDNAIAATGERLRIGFKGKDIDRWPADLRVREFLSSPPDVP